MTVNLNRAGIICTWGFWRRGLLWAAFLFLLGTVYLISVSIYGEGNGDPLQYSCLENPMDGGAW